MTGDEDQVSEDLWREAAGRVQADQDIDVLMEARGLMIAEMRDVTAIDRRMALVAGDSMRLAVRGLRWLSGRLVSQAADYLVLSPSGESLERILVPSHAISIVHDLPRALRIDRPEPLDRELPWNSLLRNLIGHEIRIEIEGESLAGHLNWVGRDHISIGADRDSLTCMWSSIDAVRFDYRASS
jgi:hypothetical protein